MSFLKTTALSLAFAVGIHANNSYALDVPTFTFKVTRDSDPINDSGPISIADINNPNAINTYLQAAGKKSSLRKVKNAILWIYKSDGPGAKKQEGTDETGATISAVMLKQRFPELAVEPNNPMLPSAFQRVTFQEFLPNVLLKAPLDFGTKAYVLMDTGADEPSGSILSISGTLCGNSMFRLTHKDVVMAARGFKFIKGSGTCDESTGGIASGGVFLMQNGAKLIVDASEFSGSRASLGSAILNSGSSLRVYNSVFQGNGPLKAVAAAANDTTNTGLIGGGAIATDGGGTTRISGYSEVNWSTMRLQELKSFDITADPGEPNSAFPLKFTRFTGNASNTGGALFCKGNSKLEVRNAYFELNVAATLNSGSQFSNLQTAGGAIAALEGCKLSVTHSIFSGNEAIGSGAAIFAEGSDSVIEGNIFEDHKTYLNNHIPQAGQVLGGVIASRSADMQVFRNSFIRSRSAYGTILVIGTGTNGVRITNNTIRGGNGASNTPINVSGIEYPWKIDSKSNSIQGTTAIEVRNLISTFGAVNHDEISHNTIWNNNSIYPQDVKIDNSTIGFFNNIVVRNGGNSAPCKFTNYTKGQSRGNAEYFPPPNPDALILLSSCTDPTGAGSTRQEPWLKTIDKGFEGRFKGAYPALYFFPGIHPGDPNAVDYTQYYNKFDQFGSPRKDAAEAHLVGSYAFPSSLF